MTTEKSGIWYYEVFLLTSGVVQVGWATPSCQFTPEQSYGVGDNSVNTVLTMLFSSKFLT